MDTEFVDFLDKKFQKVSAQIEGMHLDVKGDIRALEGRLRRLEEIVERLVTSIDRLTKLYEDVRDEQTFIIADLRRIKAVLKEKLGVDL